MPHLVSTWVVGHTLVVHLGRWTPNQLKRGSWERLVSTLLQHASLAIGRGRAICRLAGPIARLEPLARHLQLGVLACLEVAL